MTESKPIQSASKALAVESIVENAVKLPGVKVNRVAFLSNAFQKEPVNIQKILEVGPVAAHCSQVMLARMANKLILMETSKSSVTSFVVGIPGGLAMAASIPADTLQYFGMSLRLAQELSYLYGADDLWQNGELDSERVCNQLIMYCGVMFGVSGAAAGVRLLSSQVAKHALKKIPQKALMKTIWFPVVKQVGKMIGVKITKDTVAKSVSKVIPVLGGVISGGITFATMKPMGERLAKTLEEANFHYTEAKIIADCEIVQDMANDDNPSVAVVEHAIVSKGESVQLIQEEGIFVKIEKLSKLKEIGAISEVEFNAKKAELLARI